MIEYKTMYKKAGKFNCWSFFVDRLWAVVYIVLVGLIRSGDRGGCPYGDFILK